MMSLAILSSNLEQSVSFLVLRSTIETLSQEVYLPEVMRNDDNTAIKSIDSVCE